MPRPSLNDGLQALKQQLEHLTIEELDTNHQHELAYVETFQQNIERQNFRLAESALEPVQEYYQEQCRFLKVIEKDVHEKANEAMDRYLLLLVYAARQLPEAAQKAKFWCYPMAKNLRAKIAESDTLIVYDVSNAATEKLKSEAGNVEIAHNVREVAEKAETILTALPEPSHVKKVYNEMLTPANLRTEAPNKEERLLIDCSTVDPRTSEEVTEKVNESGVGNFVDAPMSGGVVGATKRHTRIMVGAAPELIDRVKEVLSLMGRRVIHMGPPTSGLKGKLANNYLLACNNIATAEAMNMGMKWGLDPKVLAELINSATGKCWPSETNNPVPGVVENAPAGRDYEGGFGTALMLKDLGLALTACAQADIVPRFGPFAQEIYQATQNDEKCKNRDFSVVYRYLGGEE